MLNLKHLETDLSPYRRQLNDIKDLLGGAEALPDPVPGFAALRERRLAGESRADLLPEAYAFVFRAVEAALGLTPHDVQLLAACALAAGRIIELNTGEGKTLAAVFPAALAALDGAGVHVLTANDYLAERDARWMGPVYARLGLSAEAISETSPPEARRTAYGADVTYLTAKEAGFDYLRGFLAYEPGELVQRPFHMAVIDEVDSILIDEARIPLVLGDGGSAAAEVSAVRLVAGLEPGLHVGSDDYGSIWYLEEAGIARIEEALGVPNLHSTENLALLERIDAAVKAVFQLRRDVDYIVRDGRVLIVDPTTGRVALDRQWTDGVQAAVEEKEGLRGTGKGTILGRISFQDLLQRYPAFCGMTGTAQSAAEEFYQFYNTGVTVIPPNRPCIREDLPDLIFTAKAAKYRAAVEEIVRVHGRGQPILVGTGSVAESEHLAGLLAGRVSGFQVLNAKNDRQEAAIIAEAGRLRAVTISTNMAGRGVDIRLGGTDGREAEAVRALGGLYVMGLNRHESVRIDNQLRGRAGRQGDLGVSRFFISLEDDLYAKYGLENVIPAAFRDAGEDSPLENRTVRKVVGRMQGIVEAQIFDAKATLFKYGRLLEDQRTAIYTKRQDILLGRGGLHILTRHAPDLRADLLAQVSRQELERAERQVSLYAMNRCWSDYLLYVDSVLSEVRMVSAVKGDPLAYYNEKLQAGYTHLEEDVVQTVLDLFNRAEVRDGKIDLEAMAVCGPTNTTTYMVHDGSEDQDLVANLGSIGAAAFGAPFLLLYLLMGRKRREK